MAWHDTPGSKRGYGWAWTKLRKKVLERDRYLCQCPECKRTGRVRLADEVDHITRKADGGTDEMSNLRAINHDCHKDITTLQSGKTPNPKVTTGLDGWPV